MGLQMGLSNILAEPPATDLAFEQEYKEDVQLNKPEAPVRASTEGLVGRDAAMTDCGECAPPPRNNPLVVTKKVNEANNSSAWTFYFNDFSFGKLNDFVNKMLLVKPDDTVLIHAPACLYTDDAEVIVSAIKACRSKNISISAPYILDSSVAYVATAGNKIIASCVGYMIIDMPTVGAGGKLIDAKNGMESEIYRRRHILDQLARRGFITDSEMKHIIEDQASVALFGDDLLARIENFNK